ncbi:histidinol-phosphatase [Georgenia halophila]|uniref:Histidinol-phosphatase n=2 Tax=Georgenia halophila TaxID=620889 RepID=A0ABP8LN48_9MICO
MSCDDLELLHRLAHAADAVSLRYFRRIVSTSVKDDGTIVSAADVAVEAALIKILREQRPGDGVLSEEGGGSPGQRHRQWIIDPIDGTEPFLAGRRSWGTHVALTIGGELALGIITRPTEGIRWWAIRGEGAWRGHAEESPENAQRMQVSRTARLAHARIGGFVASGSHLAKAIALHARWSADSLGDIIALVGGRVDAVIAPAGGAWDHAPQVLLVTEAGGCYYDRFGGARFDAAGGVYTNGLLTDQIRAIPAFNELD